MTNNTVTTSPVKEKLSTTIIVFNNFMVNFSDYIHIFKYIGEFCYS